MAEIQIVSPQTSASSHQDVGLAISNLWREVTRLQQRIVVLEARVGDSAQSMPLDEYMKAQKGDA